jgi:hypothetical protein
VAEADREPLVTSTRTAHFFSPLLFFPKEEEKTERTTFLCCVWRKRLSAKFFSSSPGNKKKYMTEGGEKRVFSFYLFLYFSLEWRYNI